MTTHVDVVVAFNIFLIFFFFFFSQTGNILDKQKSYNGNITKDYSPRNHIHTQTKLKQDKHTSNNTKTEERNSRNQTKHYWVLINCYNSKMKQYSWSSNIDIVTKRWSMYHTIFPFSIKKYSSLLVTSHNY